MQAKRKGLLYLLIVLAILWAIARFLIPQLQKSQVTTDNLLDEKNQITNEVNTEVNQVSYNPSSVGYTTKEGKEYWTDGYKLYEIYDADLNTFTIIHKAPSRSNFYGDWAKDKNHVYYLETPIPNADSGSFKFIDETFSKDKNRVFFTSDYTTPHVTVIPNADPATFQIIGRTYDSYFSKDKNRVFLNANVLPDSDPKTFTIIKGTWSKDKGQVYSNIIPIPNADPATFQIISDYFEKDKNQVYLQEKLVRGADPKNFKVIDINYSKDKNHVFVWGKEIVGADPSSFVPLGSYYAKDKNHVYYNTSGNAEIINGADPKSFTALTKDSCAFAKDNKTVYYQSSTFPVLDPQSFETTGCNTGKDKVKTYKTPSCCMYTL